MRMKPVEAPRWPEWLKRLLYPPACVFCGRILPVTASLWQCTACAERAVPAEPRWQIRTTSPNIVGAWAPFGYHGAPKEAVGRLKFGAQPRCADTMGWHVAGGLARMSPPAEFDVVVPVPMTSARRRLRGYNQSELLALAVGGWLGVPVRTDVLVRIASSGEQHRRNRQARLDAAADEYRVAVACPAGLRVLLVDDVLTTGSTASACAEALGKAGVEGICVVCFAFA